MHKTKRKHMTVLALALAPVGRSIAGPPNESGTQVAVAALALYYPGSILVARPLKELYAYIQGRELPPLALIARTIKTLVLSIFRWHLCDHVLLAKKGGISHSLQGRVETVSLDELIRNYPKMFKACFILVYNGMAKTDLSKLDEHPHDDHYLGDHVFGRDAKVGSYTKITAQTIVEYYQSSYGISVTGKATGNTVDTLFRSKYFNNEMNSAAIHRHFMDAYAINTTGLR
jgi:hypothetical protein